MTEEWRAIKGYEGLYEVSSFGNVKSLPRQAGQFFVKGRILKQFKSRNGYCLVSLSKEGYSVTVRVHRLVAEAFIPNPDRKPQINHKDEDKENNRIDNLEWVTQKENLEYGTRGERLRNALVKKMGIAVVQVSEDGEIVAEYASISEAARAVGAEPQNIWNSMNQKAISCKGFFWWRKRE